jgi:N-acetyl-gamma-glutamyl-phosphate reductase
VKNVQAAYEKSFAGYPLVRFGEDVSVSLKRVVGSARTHINYKVDGDKLYVFSLLDNLLKGAASQAVENFNALNDLPVATALTDMEGLL